jgi:hypothetical protein
MRPLLVVFGEPRIEIAMQLRDGAIELPVECKAIELVEQCFVKALADTVGLRAPRFGARVIDVLDREVELVLVMVGLAAEFSATIGEYTADTPSVSRIARTSAQSGARDVPGDQRYDVAVFKMKRDT